MGGYDNTYSQLISVERLWLGVWRPNGLGCRIGDTGWLGRIRKIEYWVIKSPHIPAAAAQGRHEQTRQKAANENWLQG